MTTGNDIEIVVFAGPSGSGKNTIMERVLQRCGNCTRLVTATTRAPRAGEVDGEDYYFISKERFLRGIEEGTIPEYWHAKDTDRYYGTYLPDLEQKVAEGKVVFAQVQAEGIKYFKQHFSTLAVLVVAASEKEYIERIMARNPLSKDELTERIYLINKEMHDFSQVCDVTVQNPNGRLDETVEQVINLLRERGVIASEV